MNTITSVYIKGLWGHQDINILLNGKTNFIIGVNGTGKTTLINLLAAALTFDYEKLLRIEFESIIIRLKEIGGSRRPSIRVTKDVLSSDDSLIYEIKTAAKEQPIIIPFDARFDRVYIETKDGGRVVSRRRTSNQEAHGLNEISIVLKDLIKVSWLSVNRADNLYSRDIDKRALSTIDHKIIELNNNLVRYFSVLSQQFSDHTIEFQKKSFLALINNEGAVMLPTY